MQWSDESEKEETFHSFEDKSQRKEYYFPQNSQKPSFLVFHLFMGKMCTPMYNKFYLFMSYSAVHAVQGAAK